MVVGLNFILNKLCAEMPSIHGFKLRNVENVSIKNELIAARDFGLVIYAN